MWDASERLAGALRLRASRALKREGWTYSLIAMGRADHKLIYGLEPVLAVAALAVATLDAALFPLMFVPGMIATSWLQLLGIVSAAVAAAVFLRLLISPRFHYAIRQAGDEMTGGQMFRWKPVGFMHPEWGLVGSKLGRGYIVPLRLILMSEFLVVIAFRWQGHGWFALLAFSGLMLAILLTQSQLINHFRRPSGGI